MSVNQLLTFHTTDRDDRTINMTVEDAVSALEDFHDPESITMIISTDETMYHFVKENIICLEVRDTEIENAKYKNRVKAKKRR